MTPRALTRLLTAVGAGVTFVAHQMPDGTPEWVALLIGAANAALVAWLGMRQPGAHAGGHGE